MPENHSIEDHFVLPAGRAPHERAALLLRNLDLVALALAAAPAIALGAPAVGFAVGAGAWLLQRVIQRADRVWVLRASEPTQALGRNFAEAFARIWLLAGAIVAAGAGGGRADGLAAALTIFCAYSIAFVLRFTERLTTAGAQR
jgi:hypothetical protein